MSKEVLIGMLKQGNTGEEILSILDVIAEEDCGLACLQQGSDNKGEMVDYQGNPTSIWYNIIDLCNLLM